MSKEEYKAGLNELLRLRQMDPEEGTPDYDRYEELARAIARL